MAEYIEREAARTLIKNYGKGAVADGMKTLDPVDDIISLAGGVDLIPSADVAPVRHGRWVEKPCIKSFKYTNVPVMECTECGITFCDIISNHQYLYHYCPNCGAKMNLEEK